MVPGFDALVAIFMRMVNGIGMRGKPMQQLFLGSPKKQQYRQIQDGQLLPYFDTHGAKVKDGPNSIANKRLIPVLAPPAIGLWLLPLSTKILFLLNLHRTFFLPIRVL